MPASQPSLVVIACPHCGTRYQVPYATIGAKGRTVQCAHCSKSWLAHAEPPPSPPEAEPQPGPPVDKDFASLAEDALDEKFLEEERRHQRRREADEAAEKARTMGAGRRVCLVPTAHLRSEDHQRTLDDIRAAIAPRQPQEKIDPAMQLQQQLDFSKRQRSVYSKLPAARFRRALRVASLGAVIVVAVGGVALRSPIVQQFPQLAGLYAALGLGINVVGLEFRDVHTVQSLQNGAEVLALDGRIASVANADVPVPQIIVTLLGSHHEALYEWSVLPQVTDLAPGESIGFYTHLSKPPEGAADVKLRFGTGRPSSTAGGGMASSDSAGAASDTDQATSMSTSDGAATATTTGTAPEASAGKTDDGQNSAR